MPVYLVGGGPGDPGLITVRGAALLARAEVVVYDRLSSAALLELAPPAAERISVGKSPRGPSTPQDTINALLIEKAANGRVVVRLKGGDPFLFGRGGEEAAALAAAGVPFEVVPGVTSAIAVPAYAGVPVTHRGLSRAVTVVTGQGDPWAGPDTDWEAVARVGGTVVLMMAVANRAEIAARLLAAGVSSDTPVTAVSEGTRAEQTTLRTTLGGLGAAPVVAPAVIVIGAVAGLDLGWFDRRPLHGFRVVVTRTPEQAGPWASALREAGAEVVEAPTIAVEPIDDQGLPEAAAVVGRFAWVAATSANSVHRLMAHVHDGRDLAGVQVAAIGSATAAAWRSHGIEPDLVAARSSADGLGAAFPPGAGDVLVPLGDRAGTALADALAGKGWTVTSVVAYRTVSASISAEAAARAAAAHAVVFASPSAVEGYLATGATVPRVVVCTGPTTAATARAAGLDASEADAPSVGAVLEALSRSLRS